jgi:hypothetical protein
MMPVPTPRQIDIYQNSGVGVSGISDFMSDWRELMSNWRENGVKSGQFASSGG